MRYAISSSVKALMQVDSQSSDGDSSNEEEKSRISVIKIYAIVQVRRRAG
ncbi:hypothetical protein CGSMWGv0288E_02668 [Gardnerella vaginalis 0288E]|nr:hypothetical protein CGSMWGv0288E_02668 [Gardnerella vaginalis 0288E]